VVLAGAAGAAAPVALEVAVVVVAALVPLLVVGVRLPLVLVQGQVAAAVVGPARYRKDQAPRRLTKRSNRLYPLRGLRAAICLLET
jgi:hypothetical protein